MYKSCNKCKENKSIEFFNKKYDTKDGAASIFRKRNRGLGLFKDSISVLQAALDYTKEMG